MKMRHHKNGDKHNDVKSNIEILNRQRKHNLKHKSINIDWDKLSAGLLKIDLASSAENLNKSLDHLFTPAQKYIVLRKAYKLPLNKTEREYYSRVIKKRLIGAANSELHRLAQIIMYT